MNWSLFLLNQLTEDLMLVQEGKQPFTYIWMIILIYLVAWMDPKNYQGMDFMVAHVCKGARYQKLWYLIQDDQLKHCTIHFWLYWDALQVVSMNILCLSEEAMVKYRWFMRFTMGPHVIHVQAQRDSDKK